MCMDPSIGCILVRLSEGSLRTPHFLSKLTSAQTLGSKVCYIHTHTHTYGLYFPWLLLKKYRGALKWAGATWRPP